MPAAAVIPAPRAYINVVAFKKPVVGFEILSVECGLPVTSGDREMPAPHHGKRLRHVGSYIATSGHPALYPTGESTLRKVRPQMSL